MKLLVVAADEREFRGILAHTGPARAASAVADWARSAALGADELLLVANGAGPPRAAAAVDAALAAFRPDAIVSIGFCGALDEQLEVASIIVGTEVTGANGSFGARAPVASLPHRSGVVVTIDHVARSAAEKRSLRQAGSSAVDMEAAAVAGRSAALGLPFFCIKAVTDLPGEDMANDLNAALRPDGHFDTIVILGSIFCRPLARLPELFRLRYRSVRAARALGDFFADCRF